MCSGEVSSKRLKEGVRRASALDHLTPVSNSSGIVIKKDTTNHGTSGGAGLSGKIDRDLRAENDIVVVELSPLIMTKRLMASDRDVRVVNTVSAHVKASDSSCRRNK